MYTPFIRTFILFLLCVLVADAQESAPEVNVRLSAITLSDKIEDLNFVNQSQIDSLSIQKDLRSKRVRYRGSPTIRFFRQDKSSESSEEMAAPEILGSVTLPEMTGDFLIIFTRLPGERERYNIVALPDDLETFKPGMYRFINTSPFDIALKLGDQKEIILRRNFKDVRSEFKDGGYQEAIMFSLVDGEKPLRSFKGGFHYSKDRRFIYLIGAKSKGRLGRIEYSVIPEALNSSPSPQE